MNGVRVARAVGRCIIGSLWAITGYLLAYYALLFYFGADRLHAMLGDRLYNAVIPMGGFGALVWPVLVAAIWGVPVIAGAAITGGVLQLARPALSFRWKLQIAAVVGVLLTAAFQFTLFDGWPGDLWALEFGDDTEFASGYSAFGFWSVRPGMTTGEVTALLGPALVRFPVREQPGEEWWRWTRSPHGSSYRLREILFRQGRVVEKYSEFYVD
jgi:hypothetical protein